MSNGAPHPSEKRQREASSLDAECPPPPDLTQKLVKTSDRYVAGGTFGDVYRCLYNGSSKPQEVAVKALRVGLDENITDKSNKMLRRELGIWRRLSHNNIVPFLGIAYGFGMCNSVSLVSLWMPNESLHKFLEMYKDKLATIHRLQILLDIARGLHYLHSLRIVHGDLYPNNILLDADYTARLTDFGYASLVGNGQDALAYLQRSTARPGALRWVAPELLDPEGTFHLSMECDIYSFGCIALQVLSGKQPWSEVCADIAVIGLLIRGRNPGRPESLKMDDSLWDFIQHCWSSLQDRPAADTLITFLEQYIGALPPYGPLRDLFVSSTNQADSATLNNKSTLESSGSNSAAVAPLSILPRKMPILQKSAKTYGNFQADPDDFIIIIMGPAGAGKSNFINHLIRHVETRSARNLKSDANNVIPYVVQHYGLRIVLVDTPGFDNTHQPDIEILKEVSDWLTHKYSDGTTLNISGIIYLHSVIDKRVSTSVYQNLQMFCRTCGDVALRRARLATTMWDTTRDQTEAQKIEKELKVGLWKQLLDEGAVAKRFDDTPTSAWAIVEDILAMGNDGDELLSQEELLNQQGYLKQTEAAVVLYSRFQQLIVDQRKTLQHLANKAKTQSDPTLAKSLQEEYEKIDEQLQKTFEEMKMMKIPLSRRVVLWLFGCKFRIAEPEAEDAQDIIVESPTEDSRERVGEGEPVEVIENGDIVKTQLNDSISKASKASKEAFRIDTSSMPPPPLEIPRRQPGLLGIGVAKRDVSAALPQPPHAYLPSMSTIAGIPLRPPWPSTTTASSTRSHNTNVSTYVPSCATKAIVIRGADGTKISLETLKKRSLQPSTVLIPPPSPASRAVFVRIQSEFKRKREEQARLEQEKKDTTRVPPSGYYHSEDADGQPAYYYHPMHQQPHIPHAHTPAPATQGPPHPPIPLSGGPGGHPQAMGSNRTQSKRRTDANKITPSQQGKGPGFGSTGAAPIFETFEHVVPLEMIATSMVRKPAADTESPELVDREVRALLNELTVEKFDSISDQIIAWANKSKNENDGHTLAQVTRLVFEKAMVEAAWSEMYARLCRKMMERISLEVQNNGFRNVEDKPIAGGQLFRKCLLDCCREDFERGWVTEEATNSDGYHGAQRARCHGLGFIKFVGELFKFQILTEGIMRYYVKKLLGNVENPEEEKIESLCQLLKTIGQQLDIPKARAHMDAYFSRMKELCKSSDISPRMQSMLQDVIELRDRKWVARGTAVVPTALSAVHEAAANEKVIAETQSYQRQLSMSRGGSGHGGEQNVESGPDGWHTAGGSVPRPQPKAGDLSQFGKISKGAGAPMVMGPSSVITKKDPNINCDSLYRTSSSSNMFSMLSQNPDLVLDTTAKSSIPPSRNPSVHFGQGGAPEPVQRKKLQLLPRTKPTTADPPASEDKAEVPVEMSEADAKKKIDEDGKDFFALRNMEEADVYFSNLPEEHRFRLVNKLVEYALESKEADAVLVSEFFAQASSKGQCSFEVFEAGFMPMAEFLDDTAIDAPNAFKFMAIMLKGAGFDKDEERLARIASRSLNGDKLLQLVAS